MAVAQAAAATLVPLVGINTGHKRSERDGFMEPVELIVVVYTEQGQASRALKDLLALAKRREIRLVDAAVIEKDQAGKTRLKETQDVDAKKGATIGAILGRFCCSTFVGFTQLGRPCLSSNGYFANFSLGIGD